MWVAMVLGALLQDTDLIDQLNAIADKACDLDPAIRSEAALDAEKLVKKSEAKIFRLGQSSKDDRRIPAQIVQALAGKLDPEKLLAVSDSRARLVACDLMPDKKELHNELLKHFKEGDLPLRLAAARALGRIKDATQRQPIQTEIQKCWQDQKFDVEDVLSYYVMAHWYPQGYSTMFPSYVNNSDVPTAEAAIGAMCNLPKFEPGPNFSTNAASALSNDKIGFKYRELLLRVLARDMLLELVPLLTVSDKKLRSQVVDYLDKGLKEPLHAKPLIDASKNETVKKTDDGKEPPKPLTEWIEKWLKRLTGEEGNFDEWAKTKYKTIVDKATDTAIKRGLEFLQSSAKDDGTWTYNGSCPVGVTALVVYTMLKCDMEITDKSVERGLAYILSKDPEGNYSASLVAMALGTAIDKARAKKKTTDQLPKWQARLQQIVDVIVASQKPCGGWHYDIKMKTGTQVQGPANAQNQDTYDFSNTQFAVLGLRAGANAGAKVPKQTWERALALYEKHQSKDKGWPYVGSTPQQKFDMPSAHAMTAAGAYGYMICKTSLSEKISPEDAGQMERVQAALDYLVKNWKVEVTGLGDVFYWLYSLERMCMAGKIERVGEHDWYQEGAAWLLPRQKNSGAWSGGHGETVDTCFALLFLKRAFIATPYIETGEGKKKSK
jgi:hypothetical protein